MISSDEEEDVGSPDHEKDATDEPQAESGSLPKGTLAESEAIKEPSVEKDAMDEPTTGSAAIVIDMEADISQLEAPTFTTISRGPPEPMLR